MNLIHALFFITGIFAMCFTPRTRMGDRIWLAALVVFVILALIEALAAAAGLALPEHFV